MLLFRLTDFTEVFREMGMNEIWKGRQSAAELVEVQLFVLCAYHVLSFLKNCSKFVLPICALIVKVKLPELVNSFTIHLR